ncbi:efflux RND transporter periplasmic adaptor subunit [Granulicoccus sp. GXG6511]|uniref:efflux RND transporter periplasmic adaptor subunit n=1 Tax=Granulicoccus sp. GXG6511 TaxID=3381351 RepID=UPI003D7CE083
MRKKRWIIGAVLVGAVVLVAGMLLLPGLLGGPQRTGASTMNIESVRSLKSADRQLISGSVHTAESENFYVDATKGRVDRIEVAQGDPVKKGDELYAYANSTLTIQQEKARIQIQTARRKVSTLETNHANLVRDLRRAPTTEAADQLKTQRDQVREELEMARTEVRMAELDVEELNEQVAALVVRSNFDGIVEMVNEDERNAVAQGAATKPLIRVVSNLPYEVKGSLTELQRAQIKQDLPFTATSKALPGKEWRGTIAYVSTFPMEAAGGQGQEQGGQAQYEFVAKLETQADLVPGNTLFLEINTTGADSFDVPTGAVLRDEQGGHQVFVVENNRLAKRTVTVGAEADGQIAITSPLDDATEILLNPDATSVEGMEVIR